MKIPTTNIASRLGLSLAFASALLLGAVGSQAQASTQAKNTPISSNDLETLKKDFLSQLDQMRNTYEKRISDLENQISGLQTQNNQPSDAALRAETAALKAQVAAEKAEEMYSSTLAAEKIQTLGQEGAVYPWRELDDYTKGFEFHGMLRSCFGVNGNGGTLQIFQAPLAGGRYTLGNRNDTYGELAFTNHFLQDDLKKEGVKFKARTLIGYATRKATPDGDKKDDKFSAREVYAEVEGLCKNNPGMKIWAGQRYYLDPGFQILNAEIANYSGYGFGIADFDLGNKALGKFSIAYVGGSLDDLTSDGEVNPNPIYAKNNLVLSLDDIEVPFGKGLAWLTVAAAKGRNKPFIAKIDGKLVQSDRYAGTSGVAAGFVHTAEEFFGGYNQFSISGGVGAASNMSAVVDDPFTQVNKSWSFMISDSFTIQPVQNISIAFVALAKFSKLGDPEIENANNSNFPDLYRVSSSSLKTMKWFSFGIQPVYHFNKYLDIALEGSVDWTDTKITGGGKAALFKGTVALEISPDWSFSAKPVLRLFGTAATWGDGFKGLVGGDTYKNSKAGYSVGAAVEASW